MRDLVQSNEWTMQVTVIDFGSVVVAKVANIFQIVHFTFFHRHHFDRETCSRLVRVSYGSLDSTRPNHPRIARTLSTDGMECARQITAQGQIFKQFSCQVTKPIAHTQLIETIT